MPPPTKNLVQYFKRENAAQNLLGILVRLKVYCAYDAYVKADISLVSMNQIARFVGRMSKINL